MTEVDYSLCCRLGVTLGYLVPTGAPEEGVIIGTDSLGAKEGKP